MWNASWRSSREKQVGLKTPHICKTQESGLNLCHHVGTLSSPRGSSTCPQHEGSGLVFWDGTLLQSLPLTLSFHLCGPRWDPCCLWKLLCSLRLPSLCPVWRWTRLRTPASYSTTTKYKEVQGHINNKTIQSCFNMSTCALFLSEPFWFSSHLCLLQTYDEQTFRTRNVVGMQTLHHLKAVAA